MGNACNDKLADGTGKDRVDHRYVVPATAMKAVRRAVRALAELDLELWTEQRSPNVGVDRRQ